MLKQLSHPGTLGNIFPYHTEIQGPERRPSFREGCLFVSSSSISGLPFRGSAFLESSFCSLMLLSPGICRLFPTGVVYKVQLQAPRSSRWPSARGIKPFLFLAFFSNSFFYKSYFKYVIQYVEVFCSRMNFFPMQYRNGYTNPFLLSVHNMYTSQSGGKKAI